MKAIALFLLHTYKKYLSPLLPDACKYYPTCSVYAMQAIEKHGVLRGLWMALKRILRCNPWSKGGYDPVPESLCRRNCKKGDS